MKAVTDIDREFWRGKRVLVTGHTGFKGSWLAAWLQRLGANVVGYALKPPTEPAMFHLAGVADHMQSIEGDVRDLGHLSACLEQYSPEIVIHLAAQAWVRAGYADPVTTYTTNVIGTLNVLEAVRKSSTVRVVLAITSDKCYENREWIWGYRENDRMGGHDPYSSSKGCAELLISAFRDSYFAPAKIEEHGVALASTRAGNVIGGGDWSEDRLVPDIMRAIMSGRSVQIRRPGAVRPWQFVLEPLRGYLMLAERLWDRDTEYQSGWNFGPDVEQIRPVRWIVEQLTQMWGAGANWAGDESQHPHEDHLLRLDCTKAKTVLGWSPVLDLETTLNWVVEWYRGFHDGEDLQALTWAQIDRYEDHVGSQ
ncbi:MAG: CDP-glucose 4,6-dehydratase [Pirellulaceae bacterium]